MNAVDQITEVLDAKFKTPVRWLIALIALIALIVCVAVATATMVTLAFDVRQLAVDARREALHDRGLLARALKRACVTEEALFPAFQTGSERTRLSRLKKQLRPKFQHFLS